MEASKSSPGTIGAFEAKNTLGSLLDRVEQGEEIVITRHGKPVARLVPDAAADMSEARASFERIRERAQVFHEQNKNKEKEPLDWSTLKKWRDEGRP